MKSPVIARSVFAVVCFLMANAHVLPVRAATQLSSASQLSADDDVFTFASAGNYFRGYSSTLDGTNVLLTNTTGIHVVTGNGSDDAFAAGVNVAGSLGAFTLGTIEPTVDFGPLNVTFTGGIQEFGLDAQDLPADLEAYQFTVFDGSNQIGDYYTPTVDNETDSAGNSAFIGAQAGIGETITSISIATLPVYQPFPTINQFFIGPITFGKPGSIASTPEPSSMLTLLLFSIALSAIALFKHRSCITNIIIRSLKNRTVIAPVLSLLSACVFLAIPNKAWCLTEIGSPTELSAKDSVLYFTPGQYGFYYDGYTTTVNGVSVSVSGSGLIVSASISGVDFPPGVELAEPNPYVGRAQTVFTFPDGIHQFGVYAQSTGYDKESFSLTASSSTSGYLGTITTRTFDNRSADGQSVFVGVTSPPGQTINTISISCNSSTNTSGPFFVGPVTFGP